MADLKLPIEEHIPELDEQSSPQVHDILLEEERKPIVPDEISILPLRESVIYPMLIAPLSISREGGIKLIDDAVSGNNRVIGVVAQRDPQFARALRPGDLACANGLRPVGWPACVVHGAHSAAQPRIGVRGEAPVLRSPVTIPRHRELGFGVGHDARARVQ